MAVMCAAPSRLLSTYISKGDGDSMPQREENIGKKGLCSVPLHPFCEENQYRYAGVYFFPLIFVLTKKNFFSILSVQSIGPIRLFEKKDFA